MAEEIVTDKMDNFTIDPDVEIALVNNEIRNMSANSVVKNHVIASITLGLVPVPVFDIAALITTQMNMLRSLSEHYGVQHEDTNSRSLITALISGSLPVLGVVGLSSFAKLIPGIGTLVGSASLSVSAGAVTYAVGQTFIMHFEEGGTLDDFDANTAQAFFKKQFDQGKEMVKTLRDELKLPMDDDEPSKASQ